MKQQIWNQTSCSAACSGTAWLTCSSKTHSEIGWPGTYSENIEATNNSLTLSIHLLIDREKTYKTTPHSTVRNKILHQYQWKECPQMGENTHILGEQEGKRSLKPLFFVSPSLSSSAALGTRALPAITSLPFGIWSDACLMQVNHIPDLHSHKKHGKHEFQVVNMVTWSWWRSDPVGPNCCSANSWIIVPPFPVVADCCTQVCVLG